MDEKQSVFGGDLDAFIDPAKLTMDLPKFAALLKQLIWRSVYDQTRMARTMDAMYNEAVIRYNQNNPPRLHKKTRILGSSQSTISRAMDAKNDRQPEFLSVKLMVDALKQWYTSSELRESCEEAGYPVPVFTEQDAIDLYRAAGYPLPQEMLTVSQELQVVSRSITDKLISPTKEMEKQIRKIRKAKAKRLLPID